MILLNKDEFSKIKSLIIYRVKKITEEFYSLANNDFCTQKIIYENANIRIKIIRY